MARGLPTRVGSRSGEPPFDWEHRATWAPALRGVGAVYVTYYPDLAVPGAAETVGSFAELAVANGVTRLVLLAGRGEPEAEHAEQAVRDSGAELTVLRSSWFSQNFSESYFLDDVLSGEVALPASTTKEPFVDADDIADVAVAALIDDRHIGELYELTGPRLLGFDDAVGGDRRRDRPRAPLRAGAARRRSRRRSPSRTCPATSSSCSPTCSAKCWTAATPTWRTASSARSGGSRGTSATTPARRPPPASGTRPPSIGVRPDVSHDCSPPPPEASRRRRGSSGRVRDRPSAEPFGSRPRTVGRRRTPTKGGP